MSKLPAAFASGDKLLYLKRHLTNLMEILGASCWENRKGEDPRTLQSGKFTRSWGSSWILPSARGRQVYLEQEQICYGFSYLQKLGC